jgi:hypothetical protein
MTFAACSGRTALRYRGGRAEFQLGQVRDVLGRVAPVAGTVIWQALRR